MNRMMAILVCILAAALPGAAAPADVASQAKNAHTVLVATVIDVQSRFGTNKFGDQLILSDVVLDVSETLKGDHAPVVIVAIEGGRIGDLALEVSDMPSLERGQRAVFFLDRTTGGLTPHRRGHGVLKLDASDRIANSELSLGQVKRQIQEALK